MAGNDQEFLADLRQLAESGPRRSASALLVTVSALLITTVAWSCYATLDEITHGVGRVIPSRELQVVQHLEGGILAELLVREGDLVAQDQVILRIRETQQATSYEAKHAELVGLVARVERLEAERGGREPNFPELVLTNRPELAVGERQLFEARRTELASAVEVLQQQLLQRRSEVTELEERQRRIAASLGMIREELALLRPMFQKGVASRVEVLRREREANDLEAQSNGAKLALPRVRSSIAEAERRIDEKRDGFRTAISRELAETRVKLAEVEETVTALKDRLTRTDVRAPLAGTVKSVRVKTLGGVIQSGMPLVEIVPLDDTLLIETQIRPSDIAFIRPQQAARVQITAYDFTTYGALNGVVEHIAADSVVKEGVASYYIIHVRTDRDYLEKAGQRHPIIPGMVADVGIVTGNRTLFAYMLRPILRGVDRAFTER